MIELSLFLKSIKNYGYFLKGILLSLLLFSCHSNVQNYEALNPLVLKMQIPAAPPIEEKISNPRSAIFIPKVQTPNRLFSAELSKPLKFASSNNLIRKAGSFYQAKGEVTHITGKVTDSFGVPISGAIIEIWQTNSAGKYQNLLEKNSEFIDVNFSMSGRAITDNLGVYHFVTIIPGSYLNRAPHINMNIYHKQFGKIMTEMYFENHPKNAIDHEYLSYNKEERELLTAKVKLSNMFDKNSLKICNFNIVMDGIHKYKSFGNDI